jgi:hypothetical protein
MRPRILLAAKLALVTPLALPALAVIGALEAVGEGLAALRRSLRYVVTGK